MVVATIALGPPLVFCALEELRCRVVPPGEASSFADGLQEYQLAAVDALLVVRQTSGDRAQDVFGAVRRRGIGKTKKKALPTTRPYPDRRVEASQPICACRATYAGADIANAIAPSIPPG